MIKYFSVVCVVVSILCLSGCDFYQESYLTTEKIKVEQSRFDHSVDVKKFDMDHAAYIANLYNNAGFGDVRLTVTYDSKSSVNTSSKAHKNLAQAVSMLRKQGIDEVLGNIMPVYDSGDDSKVLITFGAYQAKAPDGCTLMPGYESISLEHDRDYKLGCTRETLVSKQIARPKDLIGQEVSNVTDGRRSANILEIYRSGIPNEPLEGMDASGN